MPDLAGRRPRLALAALLAFALLAGRSEAVAQTPTTGETGAPREAPSGTRFASFDVGFGAVFPEGGEVGISYGVGVDVADLLVHGAAIRFGFRFWTSEDRQADGRVVDLDDTVLSLSLKKVVKLGRMDGYGGIGVGGHFVSARYADLLGEEEDERDGFHPGLEGLAGLEFPVVDRGFVSLFAEGQGSLLSDLSQLSLHAGVRIRFDRLGTGG